MEKEKKTWLRWGDLKNRLANHGIKEHELRKAKKNKHITPVCFRDGARAYYDWSEAKAYFQL